MLAYPMEEELQELSLEELEKEKENVLKNIERYETGNIPEDEWRFKPSPKLIYECEKEYLQTVETIISSKKNNQ